MGLQDPHLPVATGIHHWWREPAMLLRFTRDLIADELQGLRPGSAVNPAEWNAKTAIDADLGADSLEIMQLATALAETTHLHESGMEDALLARRSLGDWAGIAQAGLERHASLVTFRTSGSTGMPKPCTHALSSLLQEVHALAALFPPRKRVLCVVPSHHIYGFLWSVLLPRALGIGACDIIDLRAVSPSRVARLLAPGDLVVGHPAFWDGAGRLITECPADVVGITSTGPCSSAVGAAVRGSGIAQFLDIYGSSETGGIGWRAIPTQTYRLLSCWRRVLAGDGGLARVGMDGMPRPVLLQDRIEWLGDDRFTLGGRIDSAVQVGGINVFPARVAATLERHPKVVRAMVRLMRPDEGDRLKAFVVPAEGVTGNRSLATELDGFLQDKLRSPARPRSYAFGHALPARSTGKAGDWIIPFNDIG